MSEVVEKSSDMFKKYTESDDPWSNRSRRLYQQIFKKATELCLLEAYKSSSDLRWYDVGAGGGNIFETIRENDATVQLGGVDISKEACAFLEDNYRTYAVDLCDLEEYHYDPKKPEKLTGLPSADIVSFVDVIYYWGAKRHYSATLKELWKCMKPGAIVVVADSLIPYQMRSYYKNLPDSELLHEFTDYTRTVNAHPIERVGGKSWNRYLKVKIYRKVPQ